MSSDEKKTAEELAAAEIQAKKDKLVRISEILNQFLIDSKILEEQISVRVSSEAEYFNGEPVVYVSFRNNNEDLLNAFQKALEDSGINGKQSLLRKYDPEFGVLCLYITGSAELSSEMANLKERFQANLKEAENARKNLSLEERAKKVKHDSASLGRNSLTSKNQAKLKGNTSEIDDKNKKRLSIEALKAEFEQAIKVHNLQAKEDSKDRALDKDHRLCPVDYIVDKFDAKKRSFKVFSHDEKIRKEVFTVTQQKKNGPVAYTFPSGTISLDAADIALKMSQDTKLVLRSRSIGDVATILIAAAKPPHNKNKAITLSFDTEKFLRQQLQNDPALVPDIIKDKLKSAKAATVQAAATKEDVQEELERNAAQHPPALSATGAPFVLPLQSPAHTAAVNNVDAVDQKAFQARYEEYLSDYEKRFSEWWLTQISLNTYIRYLADNNDRLYCTSSQNFNEQNRWFVMKPTACKKSECAINESILEDIRISDANSKNSGSKQKSIFAYPLRLSGNHWTLVLVDREKKTIEYYDSMQSYGDHSMDSKGIQEHFEKFAETLSAQEGKQYKFERKINTHLQKDTNQCGAWTLYFLEKRLENPNVDFNTLSTSPPNMDEYRKKMAKNLALADLARPLAAAPATQQHPKPS